MPCKYYNNTVVVCRDNLCSASRLKFKGVFSDDTLTTVENKVGGVNLAYYRTSGYLADIWNRTVHGNMN